MAVVEDATSAQETHSLLCYKRGHLMPVTFKISSKLQDTVRL